MEWESGRKWRVSEQMMSIEHLEWDELTGSLLKYTPTKRVYDQVQKDRIDNCLVLGLFVRYNLNRACGECYIILHLLFATG
jgi:hypothetical protein